MNQAEDGMDFNRGLLLNAGFKEAMRDYGDWDCVIFNDVDLLPEDDRNLYDCPVDQPRHMGVGRRISLACVEMGRVPAIYFVVVKL